MKPTLEDSWAEIRPYLDDAMDLAPEARGPWLEDLERRAPAIAAHVRTYLTELAELEAKRFMSATAAALLTQPGFAGRRFGAYTLDQVLGYGGMGTVWLAYRSDGRFEGQAAVKLLNVALVGHPSEQRFAREGRVLAKLQHPNIAHLLDAGVEGGSQPYLVLEHIRGEPIDRYCETHELSIRQRIELFLDVLGAVAHAHSHLIVHRDLKPSNILVTENGVAKLLDFGIAALLSPTTPSGTDLTGQLPPGLTPGYAAPEQLSGESVTTATDVYALGVLLFVLLTGRHPIIREGKTPAELMRRTIDTEAPRPSDTAIDVRDRRLLRGDLDNIIAMALRRNPLERYSTVDHFAQDLRCYLALEPVSARPRSFAYLATMFARRHRGAVAAATAVLVVLIGAMVTTTTQMLEARYQRDQARYQSRRAEASIDFLTLLMRSESGPAGPVRTFHDRLELGVEMLKKQYPAEPRFAGRMLVGLADYYSNDGEVPRANELYAQAYAIGKQNHDAELMVSAQCSRAWTDAGQGVLEGTVKRIEEAWQLLYQMPDTDVTLHLTCLMAQAALENALGHGASAETLMRRALSTLEEADGTTQSAAYAGVLTELAWIYNDRHQPREALRLIQRAAAIYDRNGRGTSAGLKTRYSAASMLTAMGEIRRALAEREVISQRLHEPGSADKGHVSFSIYHAASLLRMGKPDAALRVLDGVIERARLAGSPGWLAQALLVAGSAFTQIGNWDDADAALKEAAALAAGGLRSQHAQAELFRAELALARGDVESAHRHQETALKAAGYRTEKPELGIARVLIVAARVALARGAAEDAERFARESLAVSEQLARGADTSADVGEALLLLARVRMSAGSRADVQPMLERAIRCLTNGLDANHALTVEARNLLASPP